MSEPIFNHYYFGNVEAVRSILVAGEASVLDVMAESGKGLLHIAMFKNQLEIVELLIQFGADPYVESHSKESAYDMVWDAILCYKGSSSSSERKVDQLLEIFPNADARMDRRKLTQVHKAVMQMLHIDLEKEILLHPTLIDQPDDNGRTPLLWAAARGNSEAMRILLAHGASPDTPDFISQGPLRASLKADSPECMELLLQAGAKVNQRDRWEQTCLIAAIYYSHPEAFIPTLLSSGADANASNHVGRSAILEAVRNHHPSAVRTLLRYGVNVDNAVNDNGMTVLQGGVAYNATEAISVLLNYRFNHAALDKSGRSVLHYAAPHAAVPMLKLLARARLRGLDPRLKDQQGHTAAELAYQRIEKQRAETTETRMAEAEIADWETAFTELLLSASAPLRVKTAAGSVVLESEHSDLDDTTSFHSTIDHFAELGLV